MAKAVLEFEKPIVELERRIEEMKRYSESLDVSEEIGILEEKVNQLRKTVYPAPPGGRSCSRGTGPAVYSRLSG
jgi:acetyl-CoA carboxylase alpha subunit